MAYREVGMVQVREIVRRWLAGDGLRSIARALGVDRPGHLVGSGENAGLAFFENGDVAIHSTKFTIDYTNGSSPHQFYSILTFEDGSMFVTKGQGTTTADQEKKVASFKGAFSFIRGSGRFAGIQGEGAYTGKRFAPVPGVGAELYSDNNATYTASR